MPQLSDELARLQKLLETGQRLSLQGSYERRAADKKAMPYLLNCRTGLRKYVREHPDTVDAWYALSLAEECLLNFPAARQSLEQYLALGGERSKKLLKRLANLKQYEKKWSELMLNPVQLESLGVFLERELAKSNCDHSNRLTEAWLTDNLKTKSALILEALKRHGGYCDCEVLLNVVAG